LDALSQSPEKGLGKGVVVLDILGAGYSLWNIETNERLSLETDSNLTSANSSVSPNGKLLALEKFTSGDNFKDHLFIMDSNGQVVRTLNGEYLQSYNPAWSWLNNQQLIFNVSFLYPETPNNNNPQRFLVLNPYTGEQQYLIAKFPNIFDWTGPVTTWDYPWNDGRVAYNSTRSHAVYLGEQTIKYSLWDFAKGKSVVDILSLQGHSGPPRWSPDGSKFLMLGFLGDVANLPAEFDYHLYLIDTNGIMRVLDEGLDMNFGGYFWSPSGRYIALYVYQDNYYNRLAILDTQNMEITDYCINFIPAGDYIETPPIWSPDESQLILEDQESQFNEGFRSRLLLVDFTKGTVTQIAEDTQAKGWMTNNP
jgi:Tol biopolymer transport system component